MKNHKLIIGITGTHASGKDTVALRICERYSAENYSTGDEVRHEATKLLLDHSRFNLFTLGNKLREEFGSHVLALRALNRAHKHADIALITGIRNVGEIEYLRKNSNFYLIAVDGPIGVRYQRATARKRIGEGKTLDEFRVSEEKEMNAGGSGQQLTPCMKLADYFILNNESLEKLFERTDEVAKAIMYASDHSHKVETA